MVKVFLIGFDSPISVIGNPVFEDERFFVVQNEGFRRKILWSRILYIEEFLTESVQEPASRKDTLIADMIAEASKRKQQKMQNVPLKNAVHFQEELPIETVVSTEQVEILINFIGDKEDTLKIKVSADCLDGTYNPKLAKEIFNNPNITLRINDVLISGVPTVEGNHITFKTTSINGIKDKLNTASNMMNTVASAAVNANSYGKLPSLKLDDQFAMYSSPFKQAVKFAD